MGKENEYKIPKYLVNKIILDLDNSIIKRVYCTQLEKISGKSFRQFVEDILVRNFYDDSIKDLRAEMVKKITKTKKSWYSSAVKSLKSFTSANSSTLKRKCKKKGIFFELNSATQLLSLYGPDKFKDFYKIQDASIDELIKKRIIDIKKWLNSKEAKITDYLYIAEKTQNQLTKAVTVDTIFFICEVIINQFNGSIKGLIVERPEVLIDHAIFADGQGKLKVENNVIETTSGKNFFNDYKTPNSYTIRTLIKEETMNSEEISRKLTRLFDSIDVGIYDCLMSKRDINFVKERKIFIDENELVKAVFKSDNSHNYASVENRLKKWASTRFAFIKEGKSVVIWGILDYLKIDATNGERKIEVTVGELIQQQHINNQVIRLYKDKMCKFSLDISKELIFIMQKERFLKYTQKKESESNNCELIEGIYDYNFFANRIRFRSKKKSINLKIIKESLDDFVKNKVTVKSYAPLKGDKFKITYYNILDYELEDLLKTPTLEPLLDINQDLSLKEEQ